MPNRPEEATETPAVARLPGGDLPYRLRCSPRATRLRVTIHPERDVVVTVPRPRAVAGPTRSRSSSGSSRTEPALGPSGTSPATTPPAPSLRTIARRWTRASRPVPRRPAPGQRGARAPPAHAAAACPVSEWGMTATSSWSSGPPATGDRRPPFSRPGWRAGPGGPGPCDRTPCALPGRRPREGHPARRDALGQLLAQGRALVLVASRPRSPRGARRRRCPPLCHLRVFGRSKAFWTLLATLVPDHARRAWRRYAPPACPGTARRARLNRWQRRPWNPRPGNNPRPSSGHRRAREQPRHRIRSPPRFHVPPVHRRSRRLACAHGRHGVFRRLEHAVPATPPPSVAHGPVPTPVAVPSRPPLPVPTRTPVLGGVDGDAGGTELAGSRPWTPTPSWPRSGSGRPRLGGSSSRAPASWAVSAGRSWWRPATSGQ